MSADLGPPAAMAVIGTAGQRDDAGALDARLYDAMYQQTLEAMDEWGVRRLVSGGAAYADHLAVLAFLEGRAEGLTLFVPAPWDGRRFVSNPRVRFNPGETSNRLHAAFSRRVGVDSLGQIAAAVRQGARLQVFEGFHRRNSEVAETATHMLAMTFGGGGPPGDLAPDASAFSDPAQAGLKDGGTSDTWRKAWRCDVKRHLNLNWLATHVAGPPDPPGPGF